jgi:hypothetical protein
VLEFKKLIAKLKNVHGDPPYRRPADRSNSVMWENADLVSVLELAEAPQPSTALPYALRAIDPPD